MLDDAAFGAATLSRADFIYDHAGDACICPRGMLLTTRGTLVNDDATP
jgi:hypothetical protein